ncbi:hypothetical protein [Dokdonella sp.]|uniref:hypothetical protein n=1 Tax=Dokdonella sp. TaxID=2291710 RepID=UPI003AF6E787
MSRLDGRAVPPLLASIVLRTLDSLWAERPVSDRRILHPLGSFLAGEVCELDAIRSRPIDRDVHLPPGFHHHHPLSATLHRYHADAGFPALSCLLLVAVAAALGSPLPSERGRIARLARNIRGALSDQNSGLRLLLRGVNSVASMIRVVDRQISEAGTLHSGFRADWEWVRGRIHKWMHDDPETLRIALQPRALLPDTKGLDVPIGGSIDLDGPAPVPAHVFVSEAVSAGAERDPGVAWVRALAGSALTRASSGDLGVPPAQLAPDQMVSALASAAMAAASKEIARMAPFEAEPSVALALALATGIREMDLGGIEWGCTAAEKIAVIHPDHPVLLRRVFRPPSAVEPSGTPPGWLAPNASEVAWPLPPMLHQRLRELAPSGGPSPGTPVLQRLATDFAGRYRIWQVANEVAPDLRLAPGQARLAMANTLSQEFGPEIAQVLFGDTFSMSTGPAYYSATPADAISAAVMRIHQRWFGESYQPAPSDHMFGSRLTLTDEGARQWPAQVRRRTKSAAHRTGATAALDSWAAHRDHLAAALSAVTAARPGSWITSFVLDQVIPEYGLALIADKACDALRERRVAATGRRWLAALRAYLDRLLTIADSMKGSSAGMLADAILRSEAPLFSTTTATGTTEHLSAAHLRATMPAALQPFANHTRHRTNQFLQGRVSPELRHAQLGWVVLPFHALSDMSHWSASDLGIELASALDELMVHDGWYPASQRTGPWSWRGVPERPLRDWAAEAASESARHQAKVDEAREVLSRRWREVQPHVLAGLAAAVDEYFPALRIDVGERRLLWRHGAVRAGPMELTADHHALLCEAARKHDQSPNDATEAIAARILLYRLVRHARRAGIVIGPLPTRPYMRITAEVTPFLPGLGLAVRHAEAFRAELLARASEQRMRELGVLGTWIIASYSATRTLAHASRAMGAAASVQRPRDRHDLVRVEATLDGRTVPMVFSGPAAAVLVKRARHAPEGKAPTIEKLGAWAKALLQWPDLPDDSIECARLLEALLQAAGRLEFSGPERLASLEQIPLGVVPVARSLARDDDWPLRNAPAAEDLDNQDGPTFESDPRGMQPTGWDTSSAEAQRAAYRRLTALLDPERFPRITGRKSDSTSGWRQRLSHHLSRLHGNAGETTNVGILAGYVRHRLRYGGRRKRVLAHATLGSDLTRFGADLLAVAGCERILDWNSDEYTLAYLAVLLRKPASARPPAYDALMKFHDFLQQSYRAPEVAEAELQSSAGSRLHHADPGMITARELKQVHQALQDEAHEEKRRQDAPPESMRLAALREIMFLILEGSGLRPSSAYGLTLADVLLFGPGQDWVRVRTSGGFGRAKSNASLGYIPLEGPLWATARERVATWVKKEKEQSKRDASKQPLFASSPGTPQRFARDKLTRRLDALLKWSTGDRRARAYWLRKSRITARHEQLARHPRPPAAATYSVLSTSGQTCIRTPLMHYVSDPAVAYSRSLHRGMEVPRATILQVTGFDAAQYDVACTRAGGATPVVRQRVMLDRLDHAAASAPQERITPPPPLRSGATILPRHLADYARLIAKHGRTYAVMHLGLAEAMVATLDEIAQQLVRAKGVTPWPFPSLRHPSACMAIPRAMKGTANLYALLDGAPGEEIRALASAWAAQGHIDCVHDSKVIVQLDGPLMQAAGLWLLAETSVRLCLEHVGEIAVLRLPSGQPPSRSHAAGVQWVLALTWIYMRLVSGSLANPN